MSPCGSTTATTGSSSPLPSRRSARRSEERRVGKECRSLCDWSSDVCSSDLRLIAAGVGHGEHVALWLNNCDDWIFIAFAVQKIGAVLVPINTRFRSRDLSYVLAQSDSVFLITHDRSGPVDYAGMVREAAALPAAGDTVRDPRFPLLRRVILLGQSPHPGT